MAHFAQLNEENLVTQVINVSNEVCGEPQLQFPETEPIGCVFIADTLKLDGVWKQTSYSSSFRGCYAGVGYTFDASLGEYGEFVAPVELEPTPPPPPIEE